MIVHKIPVSLQWDYSISATVDLKNGEVTRDGKTKKLSGKYLCSDDFLYIPIEDLEKSFKIVNNARSALRIYFSAKIF